MLVNAIISCNSTHNLPKERLYQFKSASKIRISNDSMIAFLNNPAHAPLRFQLKTDNKNLTDILPEDWIQLKALKDSTIILKNSAFAKAKQNDVFLSANFGNPNQKIVPHDLHLPIKKNREVRIMQGYNGSFSHQKLTSRYALDFDMKEGDTIYAADAGRVVGVVKDYKYGGADVMWTPYANFITVFNNKANWFTQYVHLQQSGSLVKVGDSLNVGDPVGIVGMTGYTTKEHLHFNVFKTTNKSNGVESIPAKFVGYGDGDNLKQGSKVKRQ